jgi:hypothetical protein
MVLSQPSVSCGKLRRMADPKIDALLEDFLKREQKAPIEELRNTLRTVTDWQLEHEKKDEDRHADILDWRSSQERRTIALEKDVEHLTKDVDRVEETTGNHNVSEILRAARGTVRPSNGLAKMLGSELVKGAGKALGVLLLLGLGWCAHHLQVSFVSAGTAPGAASGSSSAK